MLGVCASAGGEFPGMMTFFHRADLHVALETRSFNFAAER